MTNNELLGNIYVGWFIGGILFSIIVAVVFQVGLNVGIRMALNLLDGEYPAAFKFLQKNRKVARVLPYVIGGHND